MRVLSYKEIKGNEEADILLKEGANTTFPGPESFWRLSKNYIKEELLE